MPNASKRRTVISRGHVVSDEIWLADEVRRRAALNAMIADPDRDPSGCTGARTDRWAEVCARRACMLAAGS